MSEQSLESNRKPDGSVHPGPLQSRHKSPCTKPSWDLCYIQCTDSIQREPFWTRYKKKTMNRVPIIVWNPAYIEELDGEEVDPADLAPLISGNTPIVTVPASEDEDVAEEVVEDGDEDPDDEDLPKMMQNVIEELEELSREVIQGLQGLDQELDSIMSLRDTSSQQSTNVPNVDVWDTGKAVEQEYRLHPDPTMMEVRDRLSDQVLDLLQILQERVDQHTCNDKDIRLIEGLKTILVLHSRLGVLTDIELKRQAKKP